MSNGIVIFGGTGDLAYRKLFPALYNLYSLGKLSEGYKIIGVGRRNYSNDEYKNIIKNWMKEHSRLKYTDEKFDEFKSMISYYEMDMSDTSLYGGLVNHIRENEIDKSGLIYYYAVSPQMFTPITE